ncbi:MCE family protein [Pseudonocardia sp.]|jgi:phospholipid/cholesterol/gamma-HCH transport system substrate-binding protein|uniref:MCE family protein n=1 Tax=Pseudonocardia sp. TaxID=60912 RepID=UPI0026218CBD|nr:MCE family protein [Pseudonocardia sp.]MCW2717498.1 mammalian cell entry protein [Pseudonocardia sp.]MDT7618396.1 phospholipid/cholesterol/gamma-HCH transport system substrate-binding protein [Pseudonocardiales bacterium]
MRRRIGLGRGVAVGLAGVVLVGAVSGCEFTGPGSLPLPFRDGTGNGALHVTVELPSAANLVPNSEVKVGDITVGTVTDIRFQDWHAELVVGLNPGTVLPADAVAKVGQKSLLGATYLEMGSPSGGPGVGQLRDGDVIPISRTGSYPDTEELLAALSVVLNGGGLNQIKTITTELDAALGGHEADVRSLIGNLQGVIGPLEQQRDEIVRAIDGLNRFGGQLAANRDTVAAALETIPQGLAVVNRNREDLTTALTALGNLGTVATRVVNSSQEDLLANLRDLQPTVGRLADAGKNLTQSLSLLSTFPFPYNTAGNAFKGDYSNLFLTVDVTLPELEKSFLTGTPLGGLPPLGAGQKASDPLRAPLVDNLPGLAPAVPDQPPAAGSAGQAPSSQPLPPPPVTTAPPVPAQGDPVGSLLGGGR